MTRSESLSAWMRRNEEQVSRVREATEGLSEAVLNRRPDSKTWSPAQVLEHLVISNRPYLQTIRDGLSRAAVEDSEIRNTFFGRMIVKGAGPGGKAPVIKKLMPRDSPILLEIIQEWKAQQSQFHSLVEVASDRDISGTSVRNPFFPLIRMNLADCFDILTAHTEGHVMQIEERIASMVPSTRATSSPASAG